VENDVHEEVRLAALKNLNEDKDLLEAIEITTCDRCITMAIEKLSGDAALEQVVRKQNLQVNYRMYALSQMRTIPDTLLLDLAGDLNDRIATEALRRLPPSPEIKHFYKESLPWARALAVIEKANDEVFAIGIISRSADLDHRRAALRHVKSRDYLRDLYFQENDPSLRRSICEVCNDDDLLKEFLEDEDDEGIRAHIAGQIRCTNWLKETALRDYNIEVRRNAATALQSPEDLLDIAIANNDQEITDLFFRRQPGADLLRRLASEGRSAAARSNAVLQLESPEHLQHLYDTSQHPDTRWFAGRKLGQFPIHEILEIKCEKTLMRVAVEDTHELARAAAMRGIANKSILEQLMQSSEESIATLARLLSREEEVSSGIRFLHVPNRPYQLSVFPVTCEQYSHWLEATGQIESANEFRKLKDLPVTHVSIDEAKHFCAWLGTQDQASYRLPYFHEWRHAAVAGNPDWFSHGSMKAFQNTAQSELIFFGEKKEARPMHAAISNPWGFLDIIGNVLEWVADAPISKQALQAMIPLDSFAKCEELEHAKANQFALAAGNHWANRRIRPGKWLRLICRNHFTQIAGGKVGFRVLRIDRNHSESSVHRLFFTGKTAIGYSQEDVCRELSRALMTDIEEYRRRFAVAPVEIITSRDYELIQRTRLLWEKCGALTELVSAPNL
jgi:hypothetical protein